MSAALVGRPRLGAQAAGVSPLEALAGVRGATIPTVSLRLLVALRQHPLRTPQLGDESAAVLLEMTKGHSEAPPASCRSWAALRSHCSAPGLRRGESSILNDRATTIENPKPTLACCGQHLVLLYYFWHTLAHTKARLSDVPR